MKIIDTQVPEIIFNLMRTFSFNIRSVTFFILASLVYGCDPAVSKTVPSNFTERSFNQIIEFAQENHLDPDAIKPGLAYVGASEAALRSLPTPVLLFPKSFFDNRQKLQRPERIIPGTEIKIAPNDLYVLLAPDYAKWRKMNDEFEKVEREKRKKLSTAERNAMVLDLVKQQQAEQKSIEEAWAGIEFSREDFRKIISWIDQNKDKYNKLPPTHEGENPFENDPFGLHHAYFAAANGYLQALDPHSAVIDGEAWEKIKSESEDSSFEGIGAMLRGGGNQDVIVETPLPGSPALNAGVKSGDIIRKVDGKSIENLPLSDVVKRIRGPRDTVVTLEMERATEVDRVQIPITRSLIKQKNVSSYIVPESESGYPIKEKIGVIKLSSFLYKSQKPTELIREEYENLMKESNGKLDGLVLDLRGNPGGDLEEAIRVAGLFLPKDKVVVKIKRRTDVEDRINEEDPLIKGRIPLVVLINAGSASASEIVASALMDHNAALILGERSFGKASVQGLHSRGQVILKLTTARYYAPRDYTIQVYGVKPDIELSDDAEGTFQPKFREEDMWKHLPELKERPADKLRDAWVAKIQTTVGKNEKAEAYLDQHKNDALRPDYMLIRALEYFKALKAYPKP